MVSSIRDQLDGELCVSHSGIADGARTKAFIASAQGVADVLIGTRSALFTPMPNLGLILVDEEHDGAYKNLEGVSLFSSGSGHRSCKTNEDSDCALFSNTRPLKHGNRQSLENTSDYAYQLDQGQQPQPTIRLIDARYDRPRDGLSEMAKRAIRHAIDHGQQALVFSTDAGIPPFSCVLTVDGYRPVNIAMQNQRSIASPTLCGVIIVIVASDRYRFAPNAPDAVC